MLSLFHVNKRRVKQTTMVSRLYHDIEDGKLAWFAWNGVAKRFYKIIVCWSDWQKFSKISHPKKQCFWTFSWATCIDLVVQQNRKISCYGFNFHGSLREKWGQKKYGSFYYKTQWLSHCACYALYLYTYTL